MNKFTNILKRQKEEINDKKLPVHFAEQVLNLQLEIQSNAMLEIQTVNRLVQLYSIAVEYYESINSNKYLIFKNKIVNLLLKPAVNHAMETISNQKNLFYEQGIPKPNQNIIKKKQLEQNLVFALHNAEGQVKSIIRNANDRYDSIYKIINTDIFMQQFHLRERIKSRKGKKNQILSRQSTEGDPKQSEIQDMKTFNVIEEKSESNNFEKLQTNGIISNLSKRQQIVNLLNETSQKQTKSIQQKNKITEFNAINEQQPNRTLKKSKKNKKNSLLLNSNKKEKKQDIPAQYIIPF